MSLQLVKQPLSLGHPVTLYLPEGAKVLDVLESQVSLGSFDLLVLGNPVALAAPRNFISYFSYQSIEISEGGSLEYIGTVKAYGSEFHIFEVLP